MMHDDDPGVAEMAEQIVAAARAVQQDQWLLQGDPRGLFGEHTPAC